jgi:putative NADH-flavin reductase
MTDSILGTAAGLASGYLSRKIAMIGASGNLLRKLFGSALQLGVTTVVSQNPDKIKSIGQYIFQHILRKKRNEFE